MKRSKKRLHKSQKIQLQVAYTNCGKLFVHIIHTQFQKLLVRIQIVEQQNADGWQNRGSRAWIILFKVKKAEKENGCLVRAI